MNKSQVRGWWQYASSSMLDQHLCGATIYSWAIPSPDKTPCCHLRSLAHSFECCLSSAPILSPTGPLPPSAIPVLCICHTFSLAALQFLVALGFLDQHFPVLTSLALRWQRQRLSGFPYGYLGSCTGLVTGVSAEQEGTQYK